jgi:hypothetical protein
MSKGEVEEDLFSIKGSPRSDTFHSQPDSPPLHFFPEEEDNMATPAPAPDTVPPRPTVIPPRPPTPVRPGLALPTFVTLGADPTREELLDYREGVAQFFMGVDFTLQFLGVTTPAWPDIRVAREVTTVAQIWQRVAELGQAVTRAHQTMVTAQREIMEGEVTNLRMARGATAGTGTGGNRRAKGVVPSKYGGKRGDPCRTFLVGCENYRAMEPGAFDDDQQLIHWALQLCEDKAGDHGQLDKWRDWTTKETAKTDHQESLGIGNVSLYSSEHNLTTQGSRMQLDRDGGMDLCKWERQWITSMK